MTSRSAVTPNSPTAYAAAAQVERTPGLSTKELAPLLGWTIRHTSKALTGAKHSKLIGHVRRYGCPRWYPADQMPQRLAELKAEISERMKREARRAYAKKAERLIQTPEETAEMDRGEERTVRYAKAADPLPFQCRAPSSVFNWRPAA